MSGGISPQPFFQFFDDDGDPLSGGLLYTKASGTSTALATYTDSGLTVANTNPIVLDSAGRAIAYLLPVAYKFILTTSAGVTVRTTDPVQNTYSAGVINVTDVGFGADPTGVKDSTAAIQAAIDTITTEYGGTIFFPNGKYLVTGELKIKRRFTNLLGGGATTINFNPAAAAILFYFNGCSYNSGYYGAKNCSIKNFIFASTNSVKKTAIKIEDGSELLLENLKTDNIYWTSATNDCVGIHFAGRELITIRKCFIIAEYPILIDNNSQFFTNTGEATVISCDLFHFDDCGLIAGTNTGGALASSGNFAITVVNEATVCNITVNNLFGGMGKGCFYYNNSANTGGPSFAWAFRNIRHEQGDNDANTWAIYVNNTDVNGIDGLTIDNLHGDNKTQSFLIRKARAVTVRTVMQLYTVGVSSTTYGYNIDNCSGVVFENVQVNNNLTNYLGSMKAHRAVPFVDADYAGYTFAAFDVTDSEAWIILNALMNSSHWELADNAYYHKDLDGVVSLQGPVKKIGSEDTIMTLPAGYRPAGTETFVCDGDGAFAIVAITAAGAVIRTAGTAATYLYLNGVRFKAA